eukprot:GHVT01098880.1.p1 GENE.GHVT01098880.1~~GHVT01098880.1.p1  ORF type:complete len:103 (+),score=9.04 GHVT01098880.1:704-1012(+)
MDSLASWLSTMKLLCLCPILLELWQSSVLNGTRWRSAGAGGSMRSPVPTSQRGDSLSSTRAPFCVAPQIKWALKWGFDTLSASPEALYCYKGHLVLPGAGRF